MRIILSRKGFDTGSGGTASLIVNSRPVSLPIPTKRRSATTYDDLGLGELVEQVSRGKIARDHLCHDDPMFVGGECLFGQSGPAQSHLRNQGVSVGDIFLFFGLFADQNGGDRHHRIFGYLEVKEVLTPPLSSLGTGDRPHPHTIGEWNPNNTIYRGPAAVSRRKHASLRLTQPNGRLRHWIVPTWLRTTGLSYHRSSQCWLAPDRLEVVARGQEFVADIGDDPEARGWVNSILAAVRQ